MPVVAVTGGVAAGKSTVTAVLSQLGAHVIDADLLARQAVAPGSTALAKIALRFGDSVISNDGELDRAALGAIVFSDSEAREELNAIVHPEVRSLYHQAVASAGANPSTIIVYDVPLLTEARSVREFGLIVVVHTPSDLRHTRLTAERGFTEEEATQRIRSQATDEERLAVADIVLDSSISLVDTTNKAAILFEVISSCWPDRLAEAPALYQERTS
jgi:dephospho-CoA kinase